MYKIKTIHSADQIDSGNVADIAVYNWGGEYRPVSKAILGFLPGEGFLLKIWSEEQNPRATFTGKNEGVCRDSCLEFFANFKPELTHSGYINFECNANGALLCCYGEDRYDRKTVVEMGCEHPAAVPFRTENTWGYTLLIPLKLIKDVYGNADFHTGSKIRGNFYKCGDDTDIPHYGSYTEIQWDHPDYHRPEFFADMMVC